MRNLEEQVDFLLQQAVGALHRSRLLAAEEIVAGEVGKHARADSGFAVGIAGNAAGCGARAVVLRSSGLGFEAEAIGQSPPPRLRGLQQDGLAGLAAVGILDRGIDLVEQCEFVEIALRVDAAPSGSADRPDAA